MKINKIQIGNFGKFKDYELDLDDGFQIVYGNNEDGKSTLMAFIKMMFYSKFERGKDIEKNLRKKYQPWDGSIMHGAIEFEFGEIPYRLQKNIGLTPSTDDIKLINMVTGKLMLLGKNEEVGKRFFGFDLAGFERSVFIGKIGSFSANGNSDEIAEKLMSNLALSGDENISQQLVLNRLNDAIEDMESKTKKKGILVDAQYELDALRKERSEIQIQEVEQKGNIEEYNRLKAILDEQKAIHKLLQCNADKNKFDRLTTLIDKITRHIEKEKSLEKGHFAYGELKVFLKECNVLLEETEKTRGSLEKLKGSNVNATNADKSADKLTQISDAEYNYIKNLSEQGKTHNDLLKRIDEDFIPAFISYIKVKNDFQDKDNELIQETDNIKQLKRLHEDFQKYEEEKNSKIIEKEDIINKFEMAKIQWDNERKLREQKIKFTEEKVSIQSAATVLNSNKVQKRNKFLVLCSILAILSIVLSITISPYATFGLFLAIIIGIYTINHYIERINKGDSSLRVEQELENLKMENEKELERVNNERNEYERKVKDNLDQLEKIEQRLIPLRSKNNDYQNAINKCLELSNAKDIALSVLRVRQEAYQQEKNYLFEAHVSNFKIDDNVDISSLQSENLQEVECIACRNRLENVKNYIDSKIQEELKAKACHTLKEYEAKYLEFASNLKNQMIITEAESEYMKKAEQLLIKFSEYQMAKSYEEVKFLLQKLWLEVQEIEKDKEETINIANGMGYNTPSLDYLKIEKENLIASVKFLEENGAGLEENGAEGLLVDKLQKRQSELASEDAENRFFEVQKKIRTPDKSLSQIEVEICDKEKEVKEKISYFESLKDALKVMQEASDEMRQSFGPELNRRTAEIFKNLTNGKYGNMLVNKDYEISIQSGIHYREWQYLSNGTIDQAYLALRLAITELISDRNVALPLFLDDVLIQYDDERLKAALNFLSDYSKSKGQEFQLLLFTCHRQIIDYAKPFVKKVINIE